MSSLFFIIYEAVKEGIKVDWFKILALPIFTGMFVILICTLLNDYNEIVSMLSGVAIYMALIITMNYNDIKIYIKNLDNIVQKEKYIYFISH